MIPRVFFILDEIVIARKTEMVPVVPDLWYRAKQAVFMGMNAVVPDW